MKRNLVFVEVVLQLVWIGKSSVAVFADVRPSFHVDGHVTLHMTRLREVPVADGADVWLHLSMGQQVGLQVTDLKPDTGR